MCEVLGVSPSGYYAWRTRRVRRRTEDEKIASLIANIHRYGGAPPVRRGCWPRCASVTACAVRGSGRGGGAVSGIEGLHGRRRKWGEI